MPPSSDHLKYMADLNNVSVKVRNFKCFGEEEQGFDSIKPINLIVGRNNSGKSSLLDIVEYLGKEKIEISESLWHAGKRSDIIIGALLTETCLKRVFPENTSSGGIPGNHWVFAKQFINTKFYWYLNGKRHARFASIGNCLNGKKPFDEIRNKCH